MAYKVRAVTESNPSAAAVFHAKTTQDALEKARNLRAQGLTVTITYDLGNLVNEQDLEDDV